MKRYGTYKETNLQWLGQIPAHWDLVKAKHAFVLITDKAENKDLQKVALENIESNTGRYHSTDSEFEGEGVHFQKDDILFGKLRPYLAKVYQAEFEGQSVGDIYVFRTNKQNPTFVKYLLLSNNYISVIDNSTDGAKMPRANWEFISQILMPMPCLTEQNQIVAYLDYKTSKIDDLISRKEAMVADLQKFRQSVIYEVVTKGIKSYVSMKSVDLVGIDSIPRNWEYGKLKRFASVQTGGTPDTSNDAYWNECTNNWYTPGDFSDSIYLGSSIRKVSDMAFEQNACKVFKPQTVLVVGIGATLGKVGISQSTCSANQQINGIEFSEKIHPMYGAYFLYSQRNTMKALSNSATLAIFNQTMTKELVILVPPIEEQHEIVDYLDKKTSQIDKLLADLANQIEDLRKYKASLISEAVTGKIDLRDWSESNE